MFESIKNLFRKKPECYAVPWDDDSPVLKEHKTSLYSEIRGQGYTRYESMVQTVCLHLFGCYPVYKEFFLHSNPGLFARIIIRLFFHRKISKET